MVKSRFSSFSQVRQRVTELTTEVEYFEKETTILLKKISDISSDEFEFQVIAKRHSQNYGLLGDRITQTCETDVHRFLTEFSPELVGIESAKTGLFSPDAMYYFHLQAMKHFPHMGKLNLSDYDKAGLYRSRDGTAYYLRENKSVLAWGIEQEDAYIKTLHILELPQSLLVNDIKDQYNHLTDVMAFYRTCFAITELIQVAKENGIKRISLPMGAYHALHMKKLGNNIHFPVTYKNACGMDLSSIGIN